MTDTAQAHMTDAVHTAIDLLRIYRRHAVACHTQRPPMRALIFGAGAMRDAVPAASRVPHGGERENAGMPFANPVAAGLHEEMS